MNDSERIAAMDEVLSKLYPDTEAHQPGSDNGHFLDSRLFHNVLPGFTVLE